MPRRRPEPEANPRPMFTRYGDDDRHAAMAGHALEEAGAVETSVARNRFSGIEPGVSVRESMNTMSKDFFRGREHDPRSRNQLINRCDHAYRHIGVVKFVIDMMTDFVTQGIEIYHPAASKQKRYRAWWNRVDGDAVSERLVNYLYRHGGVVPKRNFADLGPKDVDDLDQGVASTDPDVQYERSLKTRRNRIPIRYTFLNPNSVEPLGGPIAAFSGRPRWGFRLPEDLVRAIKNPKTPEDREAIKSLPRYIVDAASSKVRLIPLDADKVRVLFYRKDDWAGWADPMVLPILHDLILYEKMKEADRAALDGSISRIRLWTLGIPEHKIVAGPGSFRKLREQLLAASAGGGMDIIWDASLKLQESSTDVYKFLGSAKYEPVLQAVYAGLGIPQSLTGGGDGGGMTNNALSLKTLIERLQYARNILVRFWKEELRLLQQAFNDRQPAQIRFSVMSLSDEASEKMLWLHLYDRDLISDETVRERFGEIDGVETRRIRTEYKGRDEGVKPAKLGPYAEAAPHPDQLAAKAMLQGTLAPTEAGVKKKPKKKGDKSLLDHQAEQQDKTLDLQKQQMEHDQKLAEKQQKLAEKQGQDLHQQNLKQNDDVHNQRLQHQDQEHQVTLPIKKQAMKKKLQQKPAGQGRPQGQKDTQKRKQRVAKPRTSASLFQLQAIARANQRVISEAVTAEYLVKVGKKNQRQLSSAQAEELEGHKFAYLCDLSPGDEVTAEMIAAHFRESPLSPLPAHADVLNQLAADIYAGRGLTPSLDDLRELQVAAYAQLHSPPAPEEESDGEDATDV